MNIFVILISALLIIIILLRRRVPIGPAILTAGIFIWAAAAPQPHYLYFNGRHFYLGSCRPAAALFVERLDRNLQHLPHLRFNFCLVLCYVPGN